MAGDFRHVMPVLERRALPRRDLARARHRRASRRTPPRFRRDGFRMNDCQPLRRETAHQATSEAPTHQVS
ncbi:hypothetical protein AAFF_G00092150 [Aldrovandia affinis]|uniref:Uncharacterized protein n=1 Tax=Aldrovandia affinis TaxID=143900 RepID=A0AAD7WYU3_9TELE|nr:hypothetical protein AAFF_G00092150 [Aldrovandia affinis]